MKMKYFKIIVAVAIVVLLSGISARATEPVDVRHVTGEIQWIDVKLGKLQLKSDVSAGEGKVTEYRITEHETRVKAPVDKKFLTIKDLQPGQHVIVDVIKGQEEKIVQKITADPRSMSNYQEAYGKIEAIDETAGTFTLASRSSSGEEESSDRSYFIFEPKDIVVMQSPSSQPVTLNIKPGDVVKVEFAVSNGKQRAHSITRYSPQVTSTTTTTTVTTTQ